MATGLMSRTRAAFLTVVQLFNRNTQTDSSNRFNSFNRSRSEDRAFKLFKPFNRFAPFKSFIRSESRSNRFNSFNRSKNVFLNVSVPPVAENRGADVLDGDGREVSHAAGGDRAIRVAPIYCVLRNSSDRKVW